MSMRRAYKRGGETDAFFGLFPMQMEVRGVFGPQEYQTTEYDMVAVFCLGIVHALGIVVTFLAIASARFGFEDQDGFHDFGGHPLLRPGRVKPAKKKPALWAVVRRVFFSLREAPDECQTLGHRNPLFLDIVAAWTPPDYYVVSKAGAFIAKRRRTRIERHPEPREEQETGTPARSYFSGAFSSFRTGSPFRWTRKTTTFTPFSRVITVCIFLKGTCATLPGLPVIEGIPSNASSTSPSR